MLAQSCMEWGDWNLFLFVAPAVVKLIGASVTCWLHAPTGGHPPPKGGSNEPRTAPKARPRTKNLSIPKQVTQQSAVNWVAKSEQQTLSFSECNEEIWTADSVIQWMQWIIWPATMEHKSGLYVRDTAETINPQAGPIWTTSRSRGNRLCVGRTAPYQKGLIQCHGTAPHG